VRVKEVEDGFVLRLEQGDELIASLAEFMKERDIGSGAVTGLGAVDRARLGCYLLEEQDYSAREFEGDMEVVGLTGTLSWYDGEPFPHVHLMLTDRDFQATGGHCFEAHVSATIELTVRTYEARIERGRDEAIGLHLMEF